MKIINFFQKIYELCKLHGIAIIAFCLFLIFVPNLFLSFIIYIKKIKAIRNLPYFKLSEEKKINDLKEENHDSDNAPLI